MSTVVMTPIQRTVRFYEAPVGKKAVMAVTGVLLFGYVLAHLAGNLQIYSSNKDQINHYAAFLHNPANAGLLWGARLVLLAAVLLHVLASLQLWKMKRDARPQAYVKKADADRVLTCPVSALTVTLFISITCRRGLRFPV